MNDFDYDCMQKKRIAMGAFAHINRKRGGCSLPSDTLTEKQRKEKNGEVKSYNITRPMPWHEFKKMPEDLKREFFRNMQSFGGTAKWLAEEMNACDATIRREAELVGAPFRRGGRNEKMWKSKVAEWANADAVAVHTADAQVEGGANHLRCAEIRKAEYRRKAATCPAGDDRRPGSLAGESAGIAAG